MKSTLWLGVVTVWVLCITSAALAEPVSGTFTAVSACDAYQSFNKGTNPGLIKLTPGAKYEAVEVNNKGMDWVRVRVPDITEPLRWVSGQCGAKSFTTQGRTDELVPGKGGGGGCSTPNTYDSYVFAITWQPGFCKHVKYNGTKPECDALKNGSLVIDHLSIHGLWPNKKQCGTSYGNCGGPDLSLEESTVSQLAPWMPNFLYEQVFGNYEWKKHGTCQERQDDDYFLTEVNLVRAIDESAVGSYIKSKAGGKMSVTEFFDKIKEAYGQEVADRIMLICASGDYLQEIRVNLPKELTVDPDLRKVTQGARKMANRTDKCNDDQIFVETSNHDTNCPPAPPVNLQGSR